MTDWSMIQDIVKYRGKDGRKRKVVEKHRNSEIIVEIHKAVPGKPEGKNEHSWKREKSLGRKIDL